MRIVFVRPGYFPPEMYAGTEMTLHWLCRSLIANGHKVVVAAINYAIAGTPATVDHQCGYPAVRGPSLIGAVRVAAAQFQPDVFVVVGPGPWMAKLLPIIRNLPVVIYEHEVTSGPKGVPAELKARAVYVANSAVTSAHLSREFDIASTIVLPLFGVGQYAGIQRRGNAVLFVSLQLRKGADVAIRIAQLRPKVPFIFIESWTKNIGRTGKLREFVSRVANITLLPNQPGLGNIMPQLKLLLMPSRSQEAWGRTATEAQICGIPVLGSSRGNLPITIGPGGMTLDPDEPIERWLEAFDSIMDDPLVFEDLSRKALEHGRSFTQQEKRAYQTFEHVLLDAVARQQT